MALFYYFIIFFIFQHLGSRKLQLYNFIYIILYIYIYIYDLLTLAPNEVMLCNVKPAADELSKSIRNMRCVWRIKYRCYVNNYNFNKELY